MNKETQTDQISSSVTESTLADKEFVNRVFSLSTLVEQMPVIFPEGLSVHRIEVSCPVCKIHSGCEDIRAEIIETVNVVIIKGFLCCQNCRNISSIHARLYPDGKVESQKEDEWQEAPFKKMSKIEAWIYQHINGNPLVRKIIPPALAAVICFLAWLWLRAL